MKLSLHKTSWPLKKPFRITGHVFETCDCVVVEISDKGCIGRGEGVGAYYLGENVDGIANTIESIRHDIEDGITIESLQEILPPGGARNALDCALWDLKVRVSGQSIWDLTGLSPAAVTTVFTIGIEDTPARMAAKARDACEYPVLKVKLDSTEPVQRIEAIRAARPDALIVVDANQGFDFKQLNEVMPYFAKANISMLEQPLPRGADAQLEGFISDIPLCADESCMHLGELDVALRRYDMINIKLDKSGGLTEGLEIARQVRAAGKKVMVGNMMGSSLSMAPGLVVAQLCDFVDLDGPFHTRSDYLNGMAYDVAKVSPPSVGFWGD